MDRTMRTHAGAVVSAAIRAVLTDEAVRRALADLEPCGGRTVLVAAGKAAWRMASAAVDELGGVDGGIVITKYGHGEGPIPGLECREAGHPTPDENGFAAAEGIAGLAGAAVFSVGSDGTDGPTDAAGGYADGDTAAALAEKGLDIAAVLADNDAYHALAAVDGLIVTGPTGTNVNDVAVALLRR